MAILCSTKKAAYSALIGSLFLCFFLCSSSTTAFQTSSILNQNTFFISDHRLHASKKCHKEAASSPSTTDDLTYGIDAPYSEANYDPNAAAEYYKDRPVESLSRLSQIVGKSSGFIFDTLLDAKFNREERVRASKVFPFSALLILFHKSHVISYMHIISSLVAGRSTK